MNKKKRKHIKKLRFTDEQREEIIFETLRYLVDMTVKTFPGMTYRELYQRKIHYDIQIILEDLDFCFRESLKDSYKEIKKDARKSVNNFLKSLEE